MCVCVCGVCVCERETEREILEKLTQEGYVVAEASRLGVVHTERVCVCVLVCH